MLRRTAERGDRLTSLLFLQIGIDWTNGLVRATAVFRSPFGTRSRELLRRMVRKNSIANIPDTGGRKLPRRMRRYLRTDGGHAYASVHAGRIRRVMTSFLLEPRTS